MLGSGLGSRIVLKGDNFQGIFSGGFCLPISHGIIGLSKTDGA